MSERVALYLSRRNLLYLLSKLDSGDKALLVKHDTKHPTHPQSHDPIVIEAVEDAAYYIDRRAGV